MYMVIEATALLGLDVRSSRGTLLGSVQRLVFDNRQASLVACVCKRSSIASRKKKFLLFSDILSLDRQTAFVDGETALQEPQKELDEIGQRTGPVLGVNARTESGAPLGRMCDVLFDSSSGIIVRFAVRKLFNERLIPRQFLIAITPDNIVFKDSVNTPTFDQVAVLENVSAA